MKRRIVVFGLAISSSWGNGHATTYRALLRELARRGHEVGFFERNVPWYAENRDDPTPADVQLVLYESLAELEGYRRSVEEADAVIIGSYVPEGVALAEWVMTVARGPVLYYDIDTPVTLAKLASGDAEYLSADLVPRFDAVLSFAGGPTLEVLTERYGARRALPLYCSVDPRGYYPETLPPRWDLGYLGTYSPDRQPPLETLMLEPARRLPEGRFVVAGPQFPPEVRWPANVERIEHLPPPLHREFYASQRWTLNITRDAMRRAGWSPSVRLFEAAACGVPVISDAWPGLEEFFRPGEEILIAERPEDTIRVLEEVREEERLAISRRARARVLARHTAAHRAEELEAIVEPLITQRRVRLI